MTTLSHIRRAGAAALATAISAALITAPAVATVGDSTGDIATIDATAVSPATPVGSAEVGYQEGPPVAGVLSEENQFVGFLNVPHDWTSPTVCVAAYNLPGPLSIQSEYCGVPGSQFSLEFIVPNRPYVLRFVDAPTISPYWENYSGRDVWLGNVSHPDDSFAVAIPDTGAWWLDVYFFEDVTSSHPFFWDISFMGSWGISTGYGDGTYRPTASVTRQAMAAFLYRYLEVSGYTAPEESPFTDVPTDHPFYQEIAWMADAGISTGWEDGTFRPSGKVSRQAMSAFLFRIVGDTMYEAPVTSPFTDVSTDHPFYQEIAWMADEGISTGYNDDTYRPAATVSRQAMAAFLNRLLDVLLTLA